MNSFITKLIHIVLPSRCACCGQLIVEDEICGRCKIALKYRGNKVCNKCGQPAGSCECKHRNFLFAGIVAPFLHEGVAKQGVYGLKFAGKTAAAEYFGKEMVKELKKRVPEVVENCDFICEVPMSVEGERKRGYNQADLLARVVAKELQIPYHPATLQKIKNNGVQHEINNYTDRYNNVRGVYSTAGQKLYRKNVILVDDIKTSGATLNECAKCLRLAGAESVWCVTATVRESNN